MTPLKKDSVEVGSAFLKELPRMRDRFQLSCFVELWLCSIFLYGSDVPRKLPYCSPENFKLANASDGEWFLFPDGSFHYEYAHCRLRKFTRDQATKCLKGSHIVYMGDSISRYMYASLAHLFAVGNWSAPFSRQFHANARPSILCEKDWLSWDVFFQHSNHVLSSDQSSSQELCDCYRGPTIDHKETMHLDNRNFRYTPNRNLDDHENDVRLSYFYWLGTSDFYVAGHKNISLYPRNSSFPAFADKLNQAICPNDQLSFYRLRSGCSAQRRTSEELFANDFPTEFGVRLPDCDQIERNDSTICQAFEREILQPIGTTHLIVNTAWHSSLAICDPRFLQKLVHASSKYFSSSSRQFHNVPSLLKLAKVLYRSSTTNAFHADGDEIAKNYLNIEKDRSKYDYFDVQSITMKLLNFHNFVTRADMASLLSAVRLKPLWMNKVPTNLKLETIATTMFAKLHFEPWVNSVIHTIFLNGVCAIEEGDSFEEETYSPENAQIHNSIFKATPHVAPTSSPVHKSTLSKSINFIQDLATVRADPNRSGQKERK
jgi:hypothetical protein